MTRGSESVPLGHYDGSDAKNTNDGEVDKSRLRGTIEGVVQPGHEGAHDQEGDARVVEPGERRWDSDDHNVSKQDSKHFLTSQFIKQNR